MMKDKIDKIIAHGYIKSIGYKGKEKEMFIIFKDISYHISGAINKNSFLIIQEDLEYETK